VSLCFEASLTFVTQFINLNGWHGERAIFAPRYSEMILSFPMDVLQFHDVASALCGITSLISNLLFRKPPFRPRARHMYTAPEAVLPAPGRQHKFSSHTSPFGACLGWPDLEHGHEFLDATSLCS
jgi:hypothetical protein